MKTTFRATLCAATAGIALFAASNANATPTNPYLVLTLSAQDITTAAPAVIDVFCDQASLACTAAGVLESVTPVITGTSSPGNISVGAGTQGSIVFTAESSIASVGASPLFNNLLTSTALTVTNTSHSDTYKLSASLTAYGFQGPDSTWSVDANGGFIGSAGSNVNLAWYDDPSNTGTVDAATQIAAFTSGVANGGLSPYSYLTSGTLGTPDTALFSMTETWNYNLGPQGLLQNRLQDEDKIYAPEPASLLLLGAGSLGLGIIRRRRRS
jgi:PEP-CTERM motif